MLIYCLPEFVSLLHYVDLRCCVMLIVFLCCLLECVNILFSIVLLCVVAEWLQRLSTCEQNQHSRDMEWITSVGKRSQFDPEICLCSNLTSHSQCCSITSSRNRWIVNLLIDMPLNMHLLNYSIACSWLLAHLVTHSFIHSCSPYLPHLPTWYHIHTLADSLAPLLSEA